MFLQIARSATPARMVGAKADSSPERRWRAVLDRLGQTWPFAILVDDSTSWMNY